MLDVTKRDSNWRSGVVGDCVSSVSAGTSVNGTDEPALSGEPGVLKVSSVTTGSFRPEQNKRIVESDIKHATCPVEAGCIIVSRANSPEHVGSSALISQTIENLFLSDKLWKIRTGENCDASWLHYVVSSPYLRWRLSAGATGSSNSMKNISQRFFLGLPILIPPLPEQRRIAEILRTWGEAIEKLEALRAAKEQRRQGVLQHILGRGVDFPGGWKTKPLNKISERIRRTNDGGDHPVMTISAKSGFLMQSDKFARDMAGSSVDRYTLLQESEFAYNKGNSKTAPYGCIFALDRPTAVIPFVYFCFRLNDDQHHAFFEHLFTAGVMNHQLSKVINSGVRNDGLLNLYADDFFACQVPVPPRDEQERIARAITALNDELALIDKEITALQRQKRGLMQKLLTGEWRVAADAKTREKVK